MIALKALAALLAYPSEAQIEALAEIRAALAAEKRIPREVQRQLAALADELAAADLLEAQEAYVALFDRGRATSLHLFEHVHGDSRDRGQAMVDLKDVYARTGLELAANELPDYLPVVLEYLSTRPYDEIRDMLGDCAHILRAIGEALARRRAPHAAVFGALLAIVGEAGLGNVEGPAPSAVEEDKALDEEWVDQPVLFGLGCGDARQNSPQPVKFVRKVA
jgi:nitrate reductase delta subunit